MKAFLKNNSLMPIPRSIYTLAKKINQLQTEYQNRGKILTEKELANILQVSENEIILAKNSKNIVSSLSKNVYTENDNEISLGETIPDPNISIEEDIEEKLFIEDIKNKIYLLNDNEQKVIKYLYGIDCKQITQNEISKMFGISQSKISRLKSSALNKLKNIILSNENIIDNIDLLNRQKKERKQHNYTLKSPEELFEEFPEYTNEKILKAVELLNEENKQIIKLYYKLDTNNCNDEEILRQLKNIMLNKKKKIYVIKRDNLVKIKNILEKENSMFKLYPGFSKKQVLGIINTLTDENKKIIELKYGLNGNDYTKAKDIAKMYNTSENNINNRIKSIHQFVNRKLNQNTPSITDLYPGYSEEQILGTISTLNKEKQQIIKLRYGLNEDKKCVETKDIAKLYNIDIETMYTKLNSIKLQIGRRLEKGQFKVETIFDLYPNYTKEQVLSVINTLTDENKKIIELKYGLNENDYTETRDIAKKMNVTVALINSRLWAIHAQIKQRLERGQFERKTIFDLYPNYTKEQVLGTINTLTDENKKIIELKYGLNGNNYTGTKDIAKILNVKTPIINSRLWAIKEQISQRLEKGQFKVETIFDLYKDYTREEIIGAINNLSVESKKIIEMRYGLNGYKIHSCIELEKQYNVHRASARIHSIRKQIEKNLRLEKKETECFASRKNSNNILVDNESIRLMVEEYWLDCILDKLINNAVLEDIENKINKTEYQTYKDAEKNKVQIGNLINMLDNQLEKEVLLLRLGYVRYRHYSEEKIAKYLNLCEEEVNSIINSALVNLNNIANEKGIEITKQFSKTRQ